MSKSKLLAGMLVSTTVAFAGCQTTNPYTGEQQTSKTTIGAGIGALAGAVLGAATGKDAKDRRKRALIGAGIGGLAGAGVGAYMDQQEAKLRQKLAGTGVSVTRQGDNIVLNMPGNITFATDSAGLNASFFDVLNSVGLVVNEFDQTVIEVAGHTDNTGTEQYNQQLSEQRAAAVAAYLGTRSVRSDRMIPVGSGEGRPVAGNDTEAGRQQNRRVELTLVPLTLS